MTGNNIVDLYYNSKTSLRDSVKTLRANIQFASLNREIKTVTFTSVIPSEGKTTISGFLGISVAEAGKKTCIVECDYRHPMIARSFGVLGEQDTEEAEKDSRKIDASLKKTTVENLWVLDMKCKVPNPVELICSEAYANMVKKLREDFDFVIFDTPPLGAFIDAAHVAALTDGTILVIRQGQVEKRAAKNVLDQLKKANANVIGAVINNVKVKKVGYYYNYYNFYSGRYYYDRYDRYNSDERDEREQTEGRHKSHHHKHHSHRSKKSK